MVLFLLGEEMAGSTSKPGEESVGYSHDRESILV